MKSSKDFGIKAGKKPPHFHLTPKGVAQGKALFAKAKSLGLKPPFTDAHLDLLAPVVIPEVQVLIEREAKARKLPEELIRRTYMQVLLGYVSETQ